MSPAVSFAKTSLPFPIFAADFDPYNRGYLVVGGGGGEGRSGVPNKIAVLDISNRAVITTANEIELSRDEDSVQSLGNLATKDGLITFAGINSSQANQNAGKNEHLRSFEIKYPPRKKQKTDEAVDVAEEKGEFHLIGQRSLFKQTPSAKSETYQRLLRLSPARKSESGSKRIGAVATGLSKDSELVVFNATNSTPDEEDVIARIKPNGGAEVGDLDIAAPGSSEFSMAYCTDYDIFEQTYQYDFGKKQVQKIPNGPRRVHQMPLPEDTGATGQRGKFRCLRFLDAQNLVALVNQPNKKGAELQVFHLYPTGPASMVLQMKLPSHIKSAVSMDVCALDVDKTGNRQIALAVAGQDISIETYTINYNGATDTFSRFKSFQTFRDVHPQQLTKLCFSPFHSPPRAPDPEPPEIGPDGRPIEQPAPGPPVHPGPQYIRLASVSYGNTVVVDALPLSVLQPKDKNSRYVLSHPADEAWQRNLYTVLFGFVFLMIALVAQSYYADPNITGSGLNRFIPPGAREFVAAPRSALADVRIGAYKAESSVASVVAQQIPSSIPGGQRLQDFVAAHLAGPDAGKALVVREESESSDISVSMHEDGETLVREETDVRHWDQLSDEQKKRLKAKLVGAGRWAESEGESVLKGMFWRSYAGVVRETVGEVLREL